MILDQRDREYFLTSDADPWHFGTDPDLYQDPRIHTYD